MNLTFNPEKEADARLINYVDKSELPPRQALVIAVNGYLDLIETVQKGMELLVQIKETLDQGLSVSVNENSQPDELAGVARQSESLAYAEDMLSIFEM